MHRAAHPDHGREVDEFDATDALDRRERVRQGGDRIVARVGERHVDIGDIGGDGPVTEVDDSRCPVRHHQTQSERSHNRPSTEAEQHRLEENRRVDECGDYPRSTDHCEHRECDLLGERSITQSSLPRHLACCHPSALLPAGAAAPGGTYAKRSRTGCHTGCSGPLQSAHPRCTRVCSARAQPPSRKSSSLKSSRTKPSGLVNCPPSTTTMSGDWLHAPVHTDGPGQDTSGKPGISVLE